MLRLENIEKFYRMGHNAKVEVLRGLNATFPQEGFTSIRGPSGSGKSTLLHIMGGLDRPCSGAVRWGEEKVSSWSRNRLAVWRNVSLGFVFQSYHLLPELSALENVLLPAALSRRAAENEARVLLKQVGLGKRMEHRPAELSGGEQQRVAIARSLINDPVLVLADEPTGNLDSETAKSVMDLLLELIQQKKKALIMVTHEAELAKRASLRLVLREGRLEKDENLH